MNVWWFHFGMSPDVPAFKVGVLSVSASQFPRLTAFFAAILIVFDSCFLVSCAKVAPSMVFLRNLVLAMLITCHNIL